MSDPGIRWPADHGRSAFVAASKNLHALARQLPVLKEYGYAKTASDILVIDPMSTRMVAVIPRKYPESRERQLADDGGVGAVARAGV